MLGKVLGKRYEIVEEIGGGGMAVVFKGKDTLLNRTVAIKVLREQYVSDDEFVLRFQREAQAVASLSHPNIISIYDVGEEDNYHYLVMEYVPGQTLKQVINESAPLNQDRFLKIAVQICDALEHAHENNVIHRDIKPHNILLAPNDRVKVTDFGIARAASDSTVTYTGGMVGSVYYISPEQARGQITTAASDIYSAGVVFFQMLTGDVPFKGEGPIAIAMQHIESMPAPLRELNPDVTPAMEKVILKTIHKQPEERFSSAAGLKQALEEARWEYDAEDTMDTAPVDDIGEGEREIPKKRKRRFKPLGWVLFLLLLAGLSYTGFMAFQSFFIVGEVEVPNVVGLSLLDAEQQLRLAGFNPATGEERHSNSVDKGKVLRQRPEAHEKVKRTRRIVYLDVSLGPRMVEVPSVTGDIERTAKLKLENAGLEVAEDSTKVTHPEWPAGTVIDQEPPPQTLVAEGSAVRLIISKGPEPQYISMPDLVGLTIPEATEILEENRLIPGVITPEESEMYFTGQVVSQDFEPGSRVLQDTKVNLIVSKGPGPKPLTPTVRGIWTPDDGTEHLVRIIVDDAKDDSREEYKEIHGPGENIEAKIIVYGKGKIKILIDDELIDEQIYPRE